MWKLFILFNLFTFTAFAGTLELKDNSRIILIEERPGWEMKRDLFGMPFIYFSPQQNGQRSNISFTDTMADAAIDITSAEKTQDVYQQTKKSWATQVGATPEGFTPYEVSENKYGHKIHKIGFAFSHEGKSYVETSFYVECRGKILFSKSMRLKANASHDKDFQELLHTLDCGGV